MITEAEAKTKWCPFSRVAVAWGQPMFVGQGEPAGLAATVNRGDGLSAPTNCSASACMAWRFEQQPTPDWTENPKGYCGLAGKP